MSRCPYCESKHCCGVNISAELAEARAALKETRETLSTLVYWHDIDDRVDESWWAEARRLTAKSNPSKSSNSCPEPARHCPECNGTGRKSDSGQCESCEGKGET